MAHLSNHCGESIVDKYLDFIYNADVISVLEKMEIWGPRGPVEHLLAIEHIAEVGYG